MGTELNDAIYQANQQMEAWAQDCNKTVSCGTIEQYVEMELSIVTQRYDRFGRLVSETIENLRIKLRDTREREVSTEHKMWCLTPPGKIYEIALFSTRWLKLGVFCKFLYIFCTNEKCFERR